MRISATTLSLVLALLGGNLDDALAAAASRLGTPLAGIGDGGLVQQAQMARPSPAPRQGGRGTAPQGPLGGSSRQGGRRPGGARWAGEGSMAGYLPGRGPYLPGPGRRPGPLCQRSECVVTKKLYGGQIVCLRYYRYRFRCH